jgi:dihydroorotate dehydrogenase electron transfer subunit
MQNLQTEVLWNQRISENYGRIGLACGGSFALSKPGQFVMLGFPGCIDPLLRRPFSIHRLIEAAGQFQGIELLYKTVGTATRRLSRLAAGEPVTLLGPLGSAFLAPSTARRIYLAAGGVGVAPLVFFVEAQVRVHGPGREYRMFLGGRSREDLLCRDDFEHLGIPVSLTTDDGSCGDQCFVTTPLEESIQQEPPDLVLACGPAAMLTCVLGIVRRQRLPCQISIETMMACGMGACLGCAVPNRRDASRYLHACLDGPVFDADQIAL